MSDWTPVRSAAVLVTDDGPIRTLTLNRPERRNALSIDEGDELRAALIAAQEDADCRAVVLAGEGRIFCAGGDITAMSNVIVDDAMIQTNDLARAVIMFGKPLVAAVTGGAFGLGLALAAACDYVVSADDARYIASFGRIGLTADTGLTWTLPRRVGPAHARRMLLFAEEVPAAEARRIGLVDELVPTAAVATRARARATQLAAASAPAVAATKRILTQADQDLESLLAAERDAQIEMFGTAEFAARRDEFLSRREARGQEASTTE